MHGFHGGAAAVVPVAERLGNQFSGFVDQAIVHGPRVDADAGYLLALGSGDGGCCGQALEHLGEEGVEVPAEAAVDLHHAVGEAVDHFELHFAFCDPAQDDPAGRGADVDGGEHLAAVDTLNLPAHRRKAAATPASTGMCRPVVWDSSLPVSTAAALATCSGRTSRLSRVRWA